jgi:hypothetical protein
MSAHGVMSRLMTSNELPSARAANECTMFVARKREESDAMLRHEFAKTDVGSAGARAALSHWVQPPVRAQNVAGGCIERVHGKGGNVMNVWQGRKKISARCVFTCRGRTRCVPVPVAAVSTTQEKDDGDNNAQP